MWKVRLGAVVWCLLSRAALVGGPNGRCRLAFGSSGVGSGDLVPFRESVGAVPNSRRHLVIYQDGEHRKAARRARVY